MHAMVRLVKFVSIVVRLREFSKENNNQKTGEKLESD